MLSYFHQRKQKSPFFLISGSVSSPASLAMATSSSMNGVNKAAAFSPPSTGFGSLISTSEAQNTSVELNWSAAVSMLEHSGCKNKKMAQFNFICLRFERIRFERSSAPRLAMKWVGVPRHHPTLALQVTEQMRLFYGLDNTVVS